MILAAHPEARSRRPEMTTPSLNDLRRIFYGAGADESVSDAEYAFLLEAYASERSASSLLAMPTHEQLLMSLGMADDEIWTASRLFTAASGGGSVTSGDLVLSYFTALNDATVDTFMVATANTIANTLTLARFGLYTANRTTGDVVLVARSANDPTMFAVNATKYSAQMNVAGGFPAEYDIVQGEDYAVGILQVGVSGANMRATGPSGVTDLEYPIIGAKKAAQADIAGNIAGVVTSSFAPIVRLKHS